MMMMMTLGTPINDIADMDDGREQDIMAEFVQNETVDHLRCQSDDVRCQSESNESQVGVFKTEHESHG